MLRVLYIAQNIPVPLRGFNDIIFQLASQVSPFSQVSFLYPAERVPWFLKGAFKYRHLYRLKDWDSHGHHIHVYTYVRLPFRQCAFSLLNSISRQGDSIIKKLSPVDLCHAHYLMPDGYLAYLISRKYRIPYLVTIRDSDYKLIENQKSSSQVFRKMQKVIAGAHTVIAPNLGLKEYFDTRFQADCRLVPHGISAAEFLKPRTRADRNEVNIISVGAAIKRKNLDWAIEFVRDYHGTSDLRLTIIGDGPCLEELKHLAGHSEKIIFTGKLPHREVMEYLSLSDIFVLPSVHETFGLVYLEAAATSNAMIGLYNEGVWGYFEDDTEMLFARDRADFSQKLKVLVEDTGLRSALAARSLKRVEEYSWDRVREIYKAMYYRTVE